MIYMRSTYFISLSLILFSLSSCKNLPQAENVSGSAQQTNVESYQLQGILWQQSAAEYKALCFQAFNSATLQLKEEIANKSASRKPLAIITDIDETVLDNSPYQATQAKEGKPYSRDSWVAWGNLEEATSVPGSLDFLNYASANGVAVFYISDRHDVQQETTLNNLKKLGFPNADADHIFLKEKGVDKETRRQKVYKNYEVVMYLGDNLSDFSAIFDNQPTKTRNTLADSIKQKFGNTFIVLPNPMYGAWQTDGIYEGNYNWSPAQKDSIIREKLIGY